MISATYLQELRGDWGNYVRGAVSALNREHELRVGLDAVVQGRMPIGGLSSSAAVGVAYLLALEAANRLSVTPEQNIQLDRYIENEYLGLNNGILDQSIIMMSDDRHLTYLDCQSVEFSKIPTPANSDEFEILVVYSGLATSLVSTDYNKRVAECQDAARTLLEWADENVPATPRLRMVSEQVYAEHGARLPTPLGPSCSPLFHRGPSCSGGSHCLATGQLVRNGALDQRIGGKLGI